MKYLAGIDGGGTKTACVIGDDSGNLLSGGLSTASNYQVIGAEAAKSAIEDALLQALRAAGITSGDLEYTVLGLAGADLESDFKVLDNICREIFGHGKFKVLNDTWIGLRAGIPENWGIVTNCGTGASCSGRDGRGNEATLRNLTYETGNLGGGFEIIRTAFHLAFRSEEGTGAYTGLESEIPALFGCRAMAELVGPVLEMKLEPARALEVPVIVGRLASGGDRPCQDLLVDMGRSLGEIAGGVIRKLGMEKTEFKVTLTGGVFKSSSPLMVDEYTTTVHRTAPGARIGIAGAEPVMGAYFLALDELKAGRR
jgi:N-acetylglucosamine kinase-like BadF-type ATPase